MKTERTFTPITLTIETNHEYKLLRDISDKYEEIGNIFQSDDVRSFLINLNNALCEDNVIDKSTINDPQMWDHRCVSEKSIISTEVGHECNWCGCTQ